MEKFASAYARALFPARHASRSSGGAVTEPLSLAPGALELSIAAGIYRAVVAAERLPETLRRLAARMGAKPVTRGGATPVGCG